MNPVVHSARVTEPKKQDGTMELDVGQIDLLDLPLPPRSKPAVDSPEDVRVSKGPPPLPPLPPAESVQEEPPVPSLALPQSHPTPTASQPQLPVSARKLVDGPAKQKSPALQLAIGMGGAAVVCAIAFFAWKATHKAQPVAPPAASASAAPAPTHTCTMAPIEFTAAVASRSAAPEETATAHASS